MDCYSPVNSYSSSKTQHRCPLLWGSFANLSSQLPSTVSPFSSPFSPASRCRFPGTTLLQAIGFTAEPQCCDISFTASGSPQGSVLTSLEPHLDALLQQLLLHYIISLVSLTLISLFPFPQFSHCYIVSSSCWHLLSLFYFWLSPAVCSHLLLSPQSPAPVIPRPGEEASGGWQQGVVGTCCLITQGSGLVTRALPPLSSISRHRPSPAHPLLGLSVCPLYVPPLPSILFCLPPPALVPPRTLPHSLPGTSHLSGCGPGQVGPEGGQDSLGAEGCLGSGLEERLYSSPCGPRNPRPPPVPFILPSRSVVSWTKGHRK